ncbi:Mitochondrial transcription termination factor family protein, putative isoform 1 [Hibiscus syriacus]|uniref:Mitochondrial transcription termination factor family protein, putative isoform 1 n=1 Tax=Hibiscus syriacus TaxID=106335 RepID=A0A6A3B7S7_HIBSY|nr:Mitochondrial transcription termination factor family protein, putative isoform 1 [Hibiscus syriacus]
MFNPRSNKNITNFVNLLRIVTNNPFSNNPSLFFAVRFISKSPSDRSVSFTISYLKNKLGFSPESAVKLSKYVNFKSPQNPDSVLNIFEQHGFSKTQIRQIIKTRPNLLCSDVQKTILPKIHFFQSKGVRDPEISKLFFYNPWLFCRSMKKQKSEQPAMESKVDVFKKWGLSEEDIWEAFRKYPGVLEASKEKIAATMDFLVNEMGFQPLTIVFQENIFARSLEKRIVPRGLFARDLLKGLIKDLSFLTLFVTPEKVFIQRFVKQYKDKAPELLKLYQERLESTVRGNYKIKSR